MRIQKASRPSTEPVDEPRAIDPAGKLEGREAKSISAEGQVATYRPCPVKRDRRTKAEVAEIRAMITDVISGDPPMTVRQVFYQLVARGVIEKSEEQYHRTVIRLMTEMRLDGTLSFDWVVDESRRVRITQTYDSVQHALEHTAKFYRRSALAQSDDYLEVWCEKDALAGVLWDMTSDYDVPLMVSRGMPSLTFLHGSAQAIRRAAEHGKPTYIYQFGDHDPSGVLIPQTIKRRLTEMCERLNCPAPQVKRIALTEAQIRRHRLPTRPTKRKGNSHANSFVGASVELDAMPPRVLRELVREVIERHISPPRIQALREAEDSERELRAAAQCPLLALSRHVAGAFECPLSGAKRTWRLHREMSANDPKRT